MKNQNDSSSQIAQQSVIAQLITRSLLILKRFLVPRPGQWKGFVLCLLLTLIIKQLFLCPTTIISSSMAPTLPTGTSVVISRSALGYHPAHISGHFRDIDLKLLHRDPYRGQVVAFFPARNCGAKGDISMMWMKRVIAIPGDKLVIDGKRIYINGQQLPLTKITYSKFTDDMKLMISENPNIEIFEEDLLGCTHYIALNRAVRNDTRQEFIVPEDHVFLMGDNRDNSEDSRLIGAMPICNIVGSAHIVTIGSAFSITLKNFIKSLASFNPQLIEERIKTLWSIISGPDKRPVNKLFWRKIH